jgi:hypothetical protein
MNDGMCCAQETSIAIGNAAAPVIDIGPGTTSYLVLADGAIKCWGVCSEECDYVSCDLSFVLRTSMPRAENMKRSQEMIEEEIEYGMREGEMEMIDTMVEARECEIFDRMKAHLEARGVGLAFMSQERISPSPSPCCAGSTTFLRRYSGYQRTLSSL